MREVIGYRKDAIMDQLEDKSTDKKAKAKENIECPAKPNAAASKLLYKDTRPQL